MADSTTGKVNEMLSGNLPLVDASGKVLSPAKTTTGPTPNSTLDSATIVRGRNGEIIMGGSLVRNPNQNTDVQTSRIGDYVYDYKGNPQVVQNSYRDLVNQYVTRTGQSDYKGLGVYDYATAISKGLSAFFGAPTDSSNVGSLLGTMAAGQIAKGNPYTQTAWAGLNVLNSLVDAEANARDEFLNQEIDYDIALDFSEDENGNIIATPNYKKMETAGSGSGEKVENLTDTNNSSVSMSEDNKLDINVSKAFANSADFSEMTNFLKENYDGLTKEQANEVIDEDTGQTRLQAIEQDIKSAEQRFYYNAKSIQAFKEIAPSASDTALDQASFTQLAGYVSKDTLSKISITIYDENNEKKEVNAKEYLDSIASKSKKDRNSYMNSIGSRIQSEDISDDERVILQAQANALYAASNNDGQYKGMYKKGFFDSLGEAPVPVFNKMTLGELFAEPFGYESLNTFENNELFAGLFQIGATVAEMAAMSGLANGLESSIRGGLEKVGTKIIPNSKLGAALGKINSYAPQDVSVYLNEASVPSAIKSGRLGAPYIVASGTGDFAGRTIVQSGMQVAADAVVEGLRYGLYKTRGKEGRFDFLDEFASDMLVDALMTYGPRNYVTRTEATKNKVFDVEEKIDEEDADGVLTGESLVVPGVRVAEASADEVAKKHAERIDKLTDSDLALKTQEILFDRNAAFGKMAVEVRANVSGDNYLYRRMLRMGNDIRQLTQDVHSRFNQTYINDLNNFMNKLSDIAPKIKNWTEADKDYLNAAAQAYRFSKIHDGDETAEKEIKSFYADALNGVSDERKIQLNELLTYGRELAADVLDFYKNNGIISEQAKNELESLPEYVGNMFFPVWKKGGRISGNEKVLFKSISMERPALKSIFQKDELIDVKDLEDPLITLSQYIQNAARNVAINERATTIRDAGSIPGMKLHILSDTGGALKDVDNLKELNDTFAKKYDSIVKQTRAEYPTREQWQETNDKLVLRSKALKTAQELESLQDDAKKLNKELRSERRKAPTQSYKRLASEAFYGKISERVLSPDEQNAALDSLSKEALDGWFKDAVPEYKNRLAEEELASPKIRRAALNRMYNIWSEWRKNAGGDIIPFRTWLDMKIPLTNFSNGELDDDYISFSLNPGGMFQFGDTKNVVFIRPRETLGTLNSGLYQAEDEVLVPREVMLGAIQERQDSIADSLYRIDGAENGSAAQGYITSDEMLSKIDLRDLSKDARTNITRGVATGRITIYGDSSIEQGSMVSFDKELFGDKFSKEVGLNDVIWSSGDGLERVGQYAGEAPQKITSDVQKLFDIETEIAANKQAQLYAIDRTKDYIEPLMRRAQKNSKSDLDLDIKSYIDIQVTNALKKALKSNSSTAQIQLVISDAVEKANPFVDPDAVIQTRAEEAAEKYRKNINKKLKMKKKTTADRLNLVADKVMDSIEEKVMGAKAGVKVIDDAEATRILNSSGDSHTIRYLMDGVEQRMVLTGPGSERLVAEFYQPESWQPTSFWGVLTKKTLDATGNFATAKRVLTSSMDISRVLPNLARDWSRGIVTLNGQILLSPGMVRDWALSQGDASPERVKIVDDGLSLAREAIDRSTLTESLEVPRKNRAKSMIRAANSPDGDGFVKFIYDRTETPVKALSTLQDMGESFTRNRAMEIAYYRALGDYFSRGMSDQEAVNRAMEAAYMAGRETTVNFFRRGKLISAIARNVPYFSQNFASLESFKYSFLDNPIAVTRALQDTTFAYTALIALALSNDESRKKYFLLTEYDRSNNIIIPLANDTIITIPLDENMAAFLTPWRRTVETLAGVDPEAFYMTFLDTFEALSPFDLEGFSEGDKFNLVRGLEKLGSQIIPTWAQPLIESYTGRDLYYGSSLKVTQDDVGEQTGNWNATPGQLTTKSKNSKALAEVSERTGIPQWILQNMLSEYGGNIGQYALNTIDKLSGATEEAQGGKEWSDSIFKPFTGSDSNQVNQAFWDGVNQLKNEKKTLQRELMTIKNQITAATGEEKAALQQKRQDKINTYGTKVSDFLDQYLSAYEITGGLSKSQANQVWYLYKIYDDDANADMYDVLSTGEYYSNKQNTYNNRRAVGLAASAGLDKFIDPGIARADSLAKSASDPTANYADTYGRQAHLNSIYGDAARNVYRIETSLKSADLLGNKMWSGYDAAKAQGKAELKKYKSDWNTQVLLAIAPTVEEVGLDAILSSTVLDYLDNYLFDVNTFNRKEYIKKAFGG